jgi:hypothetical protein
MDRGVRDFPKVGGQVVMQVVIWRAAAGAGFFYSAKKWPLWIICFQKVQNWDSSVSTVVLNISSVFLCNFVMVSPKFQVVVFYANRFYAL